MQSNFTLKNKNTGLFEPVTNIINDAGFITVYTGAFSVRFERNVEDATISNDSFELYNDDTLVSTMEAVHAPAVSETAIEDEVADVIVDPEAGTVTGVDLATGADTTVETEVAPTSVSEPAPEVAAENADAVRHESSLTE